MKWLALLFAFYILALSATPCCGKDCCVDETAQSAKFPQKQEAPCSPFFMCNTCHGFVIPQTTVVITTPAANPVIQCAFLANNEPAGFYPTAWQPPRYCRFFF